MGLGGYLSAQSELEHYEAERKREHYEIKHMREEEIEETYRILSPYGLDRTILKPIVDQFKNGDPEKWVEFMMRFELGLEKPEASRAWVRLFQFN